MSGVTVKTARGELELLFAKVGVIVADEPALKDMLYCKGHGGIKPCVRCLNVTLSRFDLAPRSEHAVDFTCIDMSLVKLHTNATVKGIMGRLERAQAEVDAGTMRVKDFRIKEMMYGFNHSPYNVLHGNHVTVDMIMYDWMHVYVCSGIGDSEFGALMKDFARIKAPVTYNEIGDYVRAWRMPKALPNVAKLFSPSAISKNLDKSGFGCTASQFLTLVPVLYKYFSIVATGYGILQAKVLSIIALFEVISLLTITSEPPQGRSRVSADDLERAIIKHLRLHQDAYGHTLWVPKHHYAFHLGHIYREHGTLISCFVHERKHRVVKRYMYARDNTRSYELCSLEDVVVFQLEELRSKQLLKTGMVTASRPTASMLAAIKEVEPNCIEALVSIACSNRFGVMQNGDAVFVAEGNMLNVGELMLNYKADHGEERSIVNMWTLVRDDGLTMHWRHAEAQRLLVRTSQLVCAVPYKRGESICSTLVPAWLR